MKNLFLAIFTALFVTASGVHTTSAQTPNTIDPNAMVIISEATPEDQESNSNIQSTISPNPNSTQLTQLQNEVDKAEASLDQLRQLQIDGLIAKSELDEAESTLSNLKSKIDALQKRHSNAVVTGAPPPTVNAAPGVRILVKPTLYPLTNKSVIRSNTGNWSIHSLSTVQQFFSETFGKKLPTSAVGQSATHNRLGWNHHNSVDVGLHPDSIEGRALMSFLERSGIPFLAFRSAIRGVATGPHIHIGSPSQRIF